MDVSVWKEYIGISSLLSWFFLCWITMYLPETTFLQHKTWRLASPLNSWWIIFTHGFRFYIACRVWIPRRVKSPWLTDSATYLIGSGERWRVWSIRRQMVKPCYPSPPSANSNPSTCTCTARDTDHLKHHCIRRHESRFISSHTKTGGKNNIKCQWFGRPTQST